MAQFVLHVKSLEEGVSAHRWKLPLTWLSGQLAGCDGISAGRTDGEVDLMVTKHGREVLIRGSVTAPLTVTCARCLREFEFSVDVSLEVLMLPGREGLRATGGEADSEEEADAAELGVEYYQGDEIVLDDFLRDTLLLEVPMNPRCGEDCPGWGDLLAG